MPSCNKYRISLGLALAVLLLTGCPPDSGKGDASASPASQTAAPAAWKWPDKMPAGPEGELVSYGQKLFSETPVHLGAGAKDAALRLAGNNLACNSCHLEKGTLAHGLGLVGVARRFPAYYAPLDKQIALDQRIDACFQRSLNGKPLPPQGRELKALLAYLNWLSQEIPAGATPTGTGLPEVALPSRPADTAGGKKLYTYHCAACHGKAGEGMRKDDKQPGLGYTFPPVWGPDSFSASSNMARQSIATRYIKAVMPLGRPLLKPEEAYDIAGYMLSQPRPVFSGAATDYPNKATKPGDVK